MITGASSGIGAALTRQLLAQRYTVCAISRRAATQPDATELPGRLVRIPADLADLGAVPVLCQRVIDAVGIPNLVFCNAGVSQRSPASMTDPQTVHQLLTINLESPIVLASQLLAQIPRTNWPRVVMVGSLASLVPAPLRTAYAAAKHGLRGFARSLRTEGAAVTEVYPGFVRTPIGQNALTGTGEHYGRDDQAQLSGADPETVAATVVRAALRGRRVIRPAMGLQGRIALLLSAIAPRLLDQILLRRFMAEQGSDGHGGAD